MGGIKQTKRRNKEIREQKDRNAFLNELGRRIDKTKMKGGKMRSRDFTP